MLIAILDLIAISTQVEALDETVLKLDLMNFAEIPGLHVEGGSLKCCSHWRLHHHDILLKKRMFNFTLKDYEIVFYMNFLFFENTV